MKVAAVQMPHGPSIEANLATARAMLDDAAARGCELALLPEYWFQPPLPPAEAKAAVADSAAREDELLAFLADASRDTTMTVAGNTLNRTATRLRNVLRVADGGRVAWSQPKLHPMPGERGWGVEGGPKLVAHPHRGALLGGLVCADILYPEAARVLALLGAEIVLNPVLSAWRADDPTRTARESVFVARAWDGACFVLKAGGYLPGRIAGRSLVAAPWGLLARYRDEAAPEVLVADLDLDALRAFRKDHRGLQERRPDTYGGLVE